MKLAISLLFAFVGGLVGVMITHELLARGIIAVDGKFWAGVGLLCFAGLFLSIALYLGWKDKSRG